MSHWFWDKMGKIIIREEEVLPKEGFYLVNPPWIHLDEKEVQEKIEKGEKLFKVNVESS